MSKLYPIRRFALWMAASLLVAGILGGFSLVAPPMAPPIPNQPPGGLGVDTIGINPGYGGEACNAATTCSTNTIAVAAWSVLLIAVTIYSTTAPSAVAVHGYTPTDLAATPATAPLSQIWGMVITTAATVRPYVNFTAATYYDVEFTDFTNTVVTATYYSGVGTTASGPPPSTSATCAVTTTAANEQIFDAVGVRTTAEATITPTSPEAQLEMEATTTDVVTQETQDGATAATGVYTSTATLSTGAFWQTDCVGLLPASVPAAPTGLAAGTVTTTTIPLTWMDTASQVSTLTAGEVWQATWSGSCGTYSAVFAASSPYDAATITGLTAGSAYCFEVTVSNSTGPSADSVALTDVTTLPALATTSPPTVSTPTIDQGQTPTATTDTLPATLGGNPPVTYTWMVDYNSGGYFAATSTQCATSTGTASNGEVVNCVVGASEATGNYTYEIVLADSSKPTPTTTTSTASGPVTVNSALVAASVSPASPTIDTGQSILLTATPSGGTMTYSYQWYSSTTSGGACNAGTPLGTSSTQSLSPTANTYYCYMVTDSASSPGTQSSGFDLVTVSAALVAESVSPAVPTIDNGQSILLTANPTGGTTPYSYQWYSSATSGGACNAGTPLGKSSTLSVSPPTTTYYCYTVTDSAYSPVTQSSGFDLVTVSVAPSSSSGLPILEYVIIGLVVVLIAVLAMGVLILAALPAPRDSERRRRKAPPASPPSPPPAVLFPWKETSAPTPPPEKEPWRED